MSRRRIVLMVALASFWFTSWLAWGMSVASQPGDVTSRIDSSTADFVGRETCAMCHDAENELWTGSHHDLAMQPADPTTVLGNFDDASFTQFGVTSRFFRRGDQFFVRTEGPTGALAEYEIGYTFGVTPLQQYLVEFPGGRLQALSICWDARPRDDGGQRWFHLYPDQHIGPGDALHWTGPNQNWNYMCAECHSTNLQKNYDHERDVFETTWSEVDVACEACHGPGSEHVEWVESGPYGDPVRDTLKGFAFLHRDSVPVFWEIDVQSGSALPQVQRSTRSMETCARCHSRRSIVHDEYRYGEPLLQTHRLALVDPGLYHADGQILDEVYVHGSFLQSKMYAAGVRCTDCHEPHSLRLRREGNSLCAACHQPEDFDTPEHHFHMPGSRGASCVECHMPARNYMVVDPRRDHSLRVPRPDLSVRLGTPNACNMCHEDRTPRWAADTVTQWYGPRRAQETHYGEAIYAGRTGAAGAEAALRRIVDDSAQAPIVRGTAAALLRTNGGPRSLPTLQRALVDPAPLVRMGAVRALEFVEPQQRLRVARPLLSDSVRAVRLEAASVLAATQRQMLSTKDRQQLDRAVAEYRHALLVNADRAEAHYNLGLLEDRQDRLAAAEASYKLALRRDSTFTATYVNLADVYRRQDRDDEGVRILRSGLRVAPQDGDLRHALGLTLVRLGRGGEALLELEKAAQLSPERPRYSYVYGVALHSAGKVQRALSVLASAHELHPNDRQLLLGLATLSRDAGHPRAALDWARKLLELSPDDEQVRGFVTQLEAELR